MPGRIICLLAIAANVATADLITVDGLNADSDTGQLEGTPGGNGAGGVLEILSVTPTTGMLAITSLYRLSNVDIDGDGTFGESFDFALTFDQPTTDGTTASTIDFRDTRETFGIGTNEEFDPGESFRMSGLVLSDTSASHNVLFDGFTGIDFVSLSGLITYDGGSFTAAAGNNVLTPGGDVTFTFTSGTDGGPIEDWSVQFSTVAVPEPSGLGLVALAAIPLIARRRRRESRNYIA